MIKIFDTEEEIAKAVACEMSEQIDNIKDPVFCLAAGSTPAKTYKEFIERDGANKNIAKLKFVGLDEWVGIDRLIDGSCYQMLNRDLFQYLPLKKEQVVFFNTINTDLIKECNRIDSFIEKTPITFSLMGVGMNGHIGLNEPGQVVKDYSSIVPLSPTTKKVGQKYFGKSQVLTDGVTLGLKQIINSKRVIVVITGIHKREIVKKIFENQEEKLPVQMLLGYEHIDFYLDKNAVSLVNEELIKELNK